MLECEENYTQSFLKYRKLHTIFSQNCISEVFQAKYQWSVWSVSYSYWKTHYLGIKIHNKESRFMMLDNLEHSQCGMLTKINMHKLNFEIKPRNKPAILEWKFESLTLKLQNSSTTSSRASNLSPMLFYPWISYSD